MNWLDWLNERYRQKLNNNVGSMVISNGCFRLPHLGHYRSFEDMRSIADGFSNNEVQRGAVYIFIDKKERVEKLKPGTYCLDDNERVELIQDHCSHVDRAFIFNDIEHLQQEIRSLWLVNKPLYKNLIYVKGLDYEQKDLNMKQFIESLGGKVVLLPYHQKYSSTKLAMDIQGKL